MSVRHRRYVSFTSLIAELSTGGVPNQSTPTGYEDRDAQSKLCNVYDRWRKVHCVLIRSTIVLR